MSSDPTYVQLTVPVAQREAAEALFDYGSEEDWLSTDLITFSFSEVNYGELSFLKKLVDAGIPFNSHWGDGDEYGQGTDSCRFTPEGTVDRRSIHVADENPDLLLLMKHINDPIKLKEVIETHHNKVTPLPWDNQEHYGKLYRAAQLITPK